MRTVLYILEYLEKHKQAYFLKNAEKTFENLNWVFLFRFPKDMNFGESFIKINLYFPDTGIIANGDTAKPCEIQKEQD